MIELYGWSNALGQAFAPHAARGLTPARVTIQHRGQWIVVSDDGELTAQMAGRFTHEAGEGDMPAVGDWVALAARPDEGTATIHAVLPRRTAFTRVAADSIQTVQVVAANVDMAFLVAAITGDFNPRRLERYLASAWQSGAQPVVVLTKADLCEDPRGAVALAEAVAIGATVLAVSSVTGEGLETLGGLMKPAETSVLVGSSGAGKSTLINALHGEAVMATGTIREDDGRGRHTTTHRELVLLPGGALVLDTPGMRELGLVDAEDGLGATFEDIEALAGQCRFRDCSHANEPGCAIGGALEAGVLDPGRWRSYRKLRRELAFQERKEDHLAREADRRRWIAINKANKAAKKLRGRDMD